MGEISIADSPVASPAEAPSPLSDANTPDAAVAVGSNGLDQTPEVDVSFEDAIAELKDVSYQDKLGDNEGSEGEIDAPAKILRKKTSMKAETRSHDFGQGAMFVGKYDGRPQDIARRKTRQFKNSHNGNITKRKHYKPGEYGDYDMRNRGRQGAELNRNIQEGREIYKEERVEEKKRRELEEFEQTLSSLLSEKSSKELFEEPSESPEYLATEKDLAGRRSFSPEEIPDQAEVSDKDVSMGQQQTELRKLQQEARREKKLRHGTRGSK